jgi:threonine aldolase
VGSALVGDAEVIARARRFRKMLGGAMRQAGLIAAGALYALENHRERLGEDHENARALARGLAQLPGLEIDPSTVETNIVIFRSTLLPAEQLAQAWAREGTAVLATGPDTLRAVTHLMVDRGGIETSLESMARIVRGAS